MALMVPEMVDAELMSRVEIASVGLPLQAGG